MIIYTYLRKLNFYILLFIYIYIYIYYNLVLFLIDTKK